MNSARSEYVPPPVECDACWIWPACAQTAYYVATNGNHTAPFGSWAAAVAAAGIDYDSVCRTRRWTRQSIVETIRKLHSEGKPVNNSSMRRMGYRGLMEAASRESNFGSWAAAIEAAGLNYEEIRRM